MKTSQAHHCQADRKDRPAIQYSCDVIAHYHVNHTQDKMTKFVNDEQEPATVIYVVSDPEWIKKFAEITAGCFGQERI